MCHGLHGDMKKSNARVETMADIHRVDTGPPAIMWTNKPGTSDDAAFLPPLLHASGTRVQRESVIAFVIETGMVPVIEKDTGTIEERVANLVKHVHATYFSTVADVTRHMRFVSKHPDMASDGMQNVESVNVHMFASTDMLTNELHIWIVYTIIHATRVQLDPRNLQTNIRSDIQFRALLAAAGDELNRIRDMNVHGKVRPSKNRAKPANWRHMSRAERYASKLNFTRPHVRVVLLISNGFSRLARGYAHKARSGLQDLRGHVLANRVSADPGDPYERFRHGDQTQVANVAEEYMEQYHALLHPSRRAELLSAAHPTQVLPYPNLG